MPNRRQRQQVLCNIICLCSVSGLRIWRETQCLEGIFGRDDNLHPRFRFFFLPPLHLRIETIVVVNHVTTHNVGFKYIYWVWTIVECFDCWCEKNSIFKFFGQWQSLLIGDRSHICWWRMLFTQFLASSMNRSRTLSFKKKFKSWMEQKHLNGLRVQNVTYQIELKAVFSVLSLRHQLHQIYMIVINFNNIFHANSYSPSFYFTLMKAFFTLHFHLSQGNLRVIIVHLVWDVLTIVRPVF